MRPNIAQIKSLTVFLSITILISCSQKDARKSEDGDEANGKGIIDGNGGGGPNYKSNPWFLGAKPVTYCIQKSDDFSVDLSDLRKITKDVITDWTSTLPTMIDNEMAKALKENDAILSTRYIHEDRCREDIDLKFSFGHLDGELRQAIRYQPQKVLGFAALRTYDLKTLRGKGTVFIAPDLGNNRYDASEVEAGFWRDIDSLHDVLMHEFGHVMGFRHDESSFMYEYYPEGRITLSVNNRLTARFLKSRADLDNASYSLCGKPWFENKSSLISKRIFKSDRVCLKMNSTSGLKLEAFGGPSPGAYKVTGDAGGDFNDFIVYTADKSLTLFSYAQSFQATGFIQYENDSIPFTFDLNSDWFSIKFADQRNENWAEAAFLSTDMSVYNRSGN